MPHNVKHKFFQTTCISVDQCQYDTVTKILKENCIKFNVYVIYSKIFMLPLKIRSILNVLYSLKKYSMVRIYSKNKLHIETKNALNIKSRKYIYF